MELKKLVSTLCKEKCLFFLIELYVCQRLWVPREGLFPLQVRKNRPPVSLADCKR